jgi:hypothetical protein
MSPVPSCFILRYSSPLLDILRLGLLPLESCRHCGYALSILNHHCRHCASAASAGPSVRFGANYLPHNILSQFHYSHQLPISTLETLVDALKKLLEQNAETEKSADRAVERKMRGEDQ